MAIVAQADVTIVQWGEPAGDTNIVAVPTSLIPVPTTYAPGKAFNPPVGTNYYPKASGRSPVFNIAANHAPIAGISLAYPGAVGQINIGTGQTNFQQMVVWEQSPTNSATLTSLAIKLFAYGPGFTNGNYSFLLQKSAGEWYASAPIALTKGAYTDDAPIDPKTLTWHEFKPLNEGRGAIGPVVAIDLTSPKAVGYYSDLNGDGRYIGTYTLFFQAKASP